MTTSTHGPGARGALLVTGGAGFIGSSLVRAALADGWRVTTLDKLTYAGDPANLDGLGEGHRLVHGDIADVALVDGLLRELRPDAVLNLAAETHVDRSIDGPAEFVRTNVDGVGVLLDRARAHWAALDAGARERFRFVQVSTDEVYGALGPEGRFTEESPFAPNSPYAASKAGGDLLCRAWHRTYGLPVVVTHCSNNYGPRQFPEKLIPLMIQSALAGRALPVYGDGRNVRDWMHVHDHCVGLLAAVERGAPGESYLFGGAEGERANIDVVHALCDLLDEMAPASEREATRGLCTHRELIRFVEDRPGHDLRYAVDASKAARELGWRPAISFDAGLRETVRWYLDHAGWCEATTRRYEGARLGLGGRA